MQVVPDTQNHDERKRRKRPSVRYWRGAGGAGEAEPPAPAARAPAGTRGGASPAPIATVTQCHTYSVRAEEATGRHCTGPRGTCGTRAALHTPALQRGNRARAGGRADGASGAILQSERRAEEPGIARRGNQREKPSPLRRPASPEKTPRVVQSRTSARRLLGVVFADAEISVSPCEIYIHTRGSCAAPPPAWARGGRSMRGTASRGCRQVHWPQRLCRGSRNGDSSNAGGRPGPRPLRGAPGHPRQSSSLGALPAWAAQPIPCGSADGEDAPHPSRGHGGWGKGCPQHGKGKGLERAGVGTPGRSCFGRLRVCAFPNCQCIEPSQ